MDVLYIISITIVAVFLIVSLTNLIAARSIMVTADNTDINQNYSVLIPARNEENNIRKILDSILNQTFPPFEVIVLDDNSTDLTNELVREYSNRYSNIQLVRGEPLPSNWLGKNWACHQLANKATTDYLMFVDSDVTLNKNAFKSLLNKFLKQNADLLSVFPTQKLKGLGDALVVPLMNWILLSLLPLQLVYKSKNKSFVAANGQLLLIKKNVYNQIGGHAEVKYEVVEDMEIARRAKGSGFKLVTLLGGNNVFCTMYDGFIKAINGYTKNFYLGFKTPKFAFIFFVLVIVVSMIYPFIAVWFKSDYLFHIVLIIINRIIVSSLSNQSIFMNILLHPLQFVVMLFVGLTSVIKTHSGTIEWKGRNIV
ncbi:MAG: glycosyltransferase family 2 protein [Ignavibacteriaceae bacterium]|nr:glycosyltransferase family 2 protein [Ignavibacteriaceae bacterium]